MKNLIERIREELNDMIPTGFTSDVNELIDALETANEALKFYGDKMNYTDFGEIVEVGSCDAELDCGFIAREAQEKIKLLIEGEE
jgi:hypothetical protein